MAAPAPGEPMSYADLKRKLQSSLRKQGVIDDIKTQVRALPRPPVPALLPRASVELFLF